MIKEIMRDEMFLQAACRDATLEDASVVQDLLDTIQAHKEECVGMAANMIGVHKRIIVFWNDQKKDYEVMLNPKIIKKSGTCYQVVEGCLALSGERSTKRFTKIKVQYQSVDMKLKIHSYEAFTAQIIQHEIDHCNGILI